MEYRHFDIVAAALRSKGEPGLRVSIVCLEDRIETYKRSVRWPALEQSLQKDLDTIKKVYKERYGEYVPRFYPR